MKIDHAMTPKRPDETDAAWDAPRRRTCAKHPDGCPPIRIPVRGYAPDPARLHVSPAVKVDL